MYALPGPSMVNNGEPIFPRWGYIYAASSERLSLYTHVDIAIRHMADPVCYLGRHAAYNEVARTHGSWG
jgi:hypothetical protein